MSRERLRLGELEPLKPITKELKRVTRERVPIADVKRYPELARLSGITVDLDQASDEQQLRYLNQVNEFIQEYILKFEDDELRDDVPVCFGTAVGARGKRIGVRMKLIAAQNHRCERWAERRRANIIVTMAWQMYRDSIS